MTTNGNCAGKQVAFRVKENDTGLAELEGDGLLDDDARVQPANGLITNNAASTTWTAEYACDGILCIADPPEYHFDARVAGEGTPPVRSSDPLLTVNKAGGGGLQIVNGPTVSSTNDAATITWSTNLPSTSKADYGLIDQYIGSIPEADPGGILDHTVSIQNLASCTKYRFRVQSKTPGVVPQVASQIGSFATKGCPGDADILSEISQFMNHLQDGAIDLLEGGRGVALTVPRLYHDTDTYFQVKKLNKDKVINVLPPPAGSQPAGNNMYRFDAFVDPLNKVGEFDNTVGVTITYGPEDVAGIDETTLKIHRFNTQVNAWEVLPNCIVDTTAKTVTCQTQQFSTFALMGKTSQKTLPGKHIVVSSRDRLLFILFIAGFMLFQTTKQASKKRSS